MNNQRREQLMKLLDPIEEVKGQVESFLEEEQAAYDNMPENLQNGQNGDKAQSAISALEAAAQSLEEAIESIKESTE